MADKQEHDSKRLKTSHPPQPDDGSPMGILEKRNHLAKLGLLNEYTTLEKSVAAQQDRIKQIELSVYARARMNVEELQLQVAEEYFRSTFIDITLLSSRKAPDWIFDLDALKPHGRFAIWQAYWCYSHLYVPGEAWTKIGKHLLVDNNGARIHEQPCGASLAAATQKLEQTTKSLLSSEESLTSTKELLASTEEELASANQSLASTKEKLDQAAAALAQSKQDNINAVSHVAPSSTEVTDNQKKARGPHDVSQR